MMNQPLQEDWLDARLRDEAPYIDDAGFTAQLMQKLPAKRAARNSFRGVFLLGVTILACAVAYFISGGGQFLVSAMQTLSAMPLWMVATIALFCGMVATAAAAYAGFVRGREESLG